MFIEWLMNIFQRNSDQVAIVWKGQEVSYGWLLEAVRRWQLQLDHSGIACGEVVAVDGDFSPNAVALMLALIEHRCIMVPLTSSVEAKKPEFREIAQVQAQIVLNDGDEATIQRTDRQVDHPLLLGLRDCGHPGLIVFSSGSTGKSKATVHDFSKLLDKFQVPRKAKRMLSFLLFDHLGGINTVLYILSNGGTVVTLQSRNPEDVCRVIEAHRVQVLPTSPTFLKLLLLSEAYTRHDLSSLELVTYGTEPMSESTLKRFHELFPTINLQQTYGLTELGVLRSKSKSSDSLWVKIGGEGFETRVVSGLLEIKAHTAMLGYLNAPSPFTADGWLITGDAVEVDGDYMLIKGRASEMINVGGEKVYPAEVENVLMQMSNVRDVVVSGEPNPITGQIVAAQFNLKEPEELSSLRQRVREFCRSRLPSYKTPVRIGVVTDGPYSPRYKKLRPGSRVAVQ
jgi:acyl-coenzyme A synthetase/AMP-(fatty) acid ligase